MREFSVHFTMYEKGESREKMRGERMRGEDERGGEEGGRKERRKE